MAQTDYRGCAITGASARALELYESALGALQRGHGDVLGPARLALAASPGFVAARELEASLLVYSRDVRDVEAAGWAFARLRALPMNRREEAHAQAIAAALDGEFSRAGALYDRIVEMEPRDALALWAAQVIDYYLGRAHALRARAARVLEHWPPSLPGLHAVLAALAFGLEECGDYAAAEETAQRALELEPPDLRAQHALLHVFEMQGRAAEGVRWMEAGGAAPASNHLWWHLALFHLQLERPARALALYDSRMGLETLPDLIDASALLWRLRLAGVDVADRFVPLAARWSPYAEDAYCAFNDMHAMMAFAAAGRWDWAERLQRAQEQRIARTAGANYDMTRLVGLPACRALLAFARGDFRAAETLLRSLPPVAHRIGGSHAQRDVLQLTRAAAAAARSTLRFQGGSHALALPQRLAAA